ncbi:MAG: hypothetical protein EOR04_08535 [Mesorhizobium sp.]|uniref:hypothetical protein n=1 Tax=Mesorhizobium sp. TaxID=1871066 RepID=UPI000FEAAC72|nr:hypothetical protein [Mesorhizobium sp.]RWP43101.1 MAG: hypothetical protein EOR04_08535 [Mesorhizobium sp.]
MLTAAAMLFRWRLYQRHWQAGHGTDDGRCSQDLPEGRVWRLLSHPRCAECYVAGKRPRWSGALHGGRTLPSEVLPINFSDYIAVQL